VMQSNAQNAHGLMKENCRETLATVNLLI